MPFLPETALEQALLALSVPFVLRALGVSSLEDTYYPTRPVLPQKVQEGASRSGVS